jgi:hypothetical protein
MAGMLAVPFSSFNPSVAHMMSHGLVGALQPM